MKANRFAPATNKTATAAKDVVPANGLNELFTDKYGNERMAVTTTWCDKAAASGNDFAIQMADLGRKLGYLSPKQFSAANRWVS